MKPITVQERVAELVREHGSLRAAAAALNLRPKTLWQAGNGKTAQPRAELLWAIGLDPQSATFTRLQS